MDLKPVHGLVGLCLVGLALSGCQNSRPKPFAQGPGLQRNSMAKSTWSNNSMQPGLAGRPATGTTNLQGPLSIPGNPASIQPAGANQLNTNPTPGLPMSNSNTGSNYLGTKPAFGDSSFQRIPGDSSFPRTDSSFPRTSTPPAGFQSSVSPMKSPVTTTSMATMPGGTPAAGTTPVAPTGMYEVTSTPQPKTSSPSALESTPMPKEGPGLAMPGGS